MPDLQTIAKRMKDRLDKKEAAREGAINSSRRIIRECRSAIASIQNGENPSENLNAARRIHRQMKGTLQSYPDLSFAGYVVDAEQELAEAGILLGSVRGGALPSPEGMGISDEAYLLGLGDAIGELRRIFLDGLMHDMINDASDTLARMEEFFSVMMTFDYPEALVAVKRKQDVARGLLEKCRSELILATQIASLRRGLVLDSNRERRSTHGRSKRK